MVVTGHIDDSHEKLKSERVIDAFKEECIAHSKNKHQLNSEKSKKELCYKTYKHTVCVVSSHHSEIHLDTSRPKEDPVLQSFRLSKNEKILGLERTRYTHHVTNSSSSISTATPSSKSSPDLLDEENESTDPALPSSPIKSHLIGKQKHL